MATDAYCIKCRTKREIQEPKEVPCAALADLPAAIREMLTAFTRDIRTALDDTLGAVYVFGSLCMGDFDAGSSDIDFLAVLDGPPSAGQLAALGALHRRLAQASVWGDRLEGGYAQRRDLRPWGIAGSIAVVTPGEPLRQAAPSDYSADNMLAIREHGLALYGPPPATVFPLVDPATLQAGLRAYLDELLARPAAMAPAREVAAWALNVARCLYGLQTGNLATKTQAAQWVGQHLPTVWPVLDCACRLRGGCTDADTEDRLRAGFGSLREAAATYLTAPPASLPATPR